MDGVKSVVEVSQAAGGESSDMKKHIIDTAAPFHSVKEVVSRFGGTVDWKANRARSMERINFAEAKLEKSENQKEDLEITEKLIGEMKVSLDKAQKEEHQAKKDSELMRLKVQEMEQIIENEASIAAKDMHAAAVSALKAIEEELESLIKDHATKESLESTQTKNLELEGERTRRAAMAGDLKSILDASSSLLLDLKAKLEETKLKQLSDEEQGKELEEVKCKIAKASAEVNCLRVTSLSLKSELEEVKAAQEANQAKMIAQEAHFRLHEAKEEAEQAKTKSDEIESRLLTAQKELEDVKASEKSAIAAAKAFQESESAKSKSNAEFPSEVTLTVRQYNQLCKLADEANEQANRRILAANSQIDMAKESELRGLMKLEELDRELAERRKLLEEATEKAEKAKEGKLCVEQELRTWRADQEQRRNACEETQGVVNQNKVSKKLDQLTNKKSTESSAETKIKKKKSLSTKLAMMFSKRKTHPTK